MSKELMEIIDTSTRRATNGAVSNERARILKAVNSIQAQTPNDIRLLHQIKMIVKGE